MGDERRPLKMQDDGDPTVSDEVKAADKNVGHFALQFKMEA